MTYQLDRYADLAVVGTAATGAEALDLVRRLQPTVLVLDVRMPGTNTVELVRHILASPVPCAILMLSGFDDTEQVVELLNAGAGGYALKDEYADVLAEAVRTVAQGRRWLSLAIEAKLVDHTLCTTSVRTQPALTARELDVLRLLAQGYDTIEIASMLHVASSTVKLHLAHMYDKLNLHGQAQLVAWAWQHGVMERD